MAHTTAVLDSEQQRAFQARALYLPADSTWQEICVRIKSFGQAAIFLHPDDWYDTMVDLYGPEIFNP